MALLGCPRGHTVAHETGCLTRPGYSPSNPCAPPPEEATTALSAGNTYAFLSGAKYGSSNGPMDPHYGSLPAANVTNIRNGYNAQKNGTTCHR